jgi:hypothetical protein
MKSVLKDLRARKTKWLRSAGKQMAELMEKEWKAYARE